MILNESFTLKATQLIFFFFFYFCQVVMNLCITHRIRIIHMILDFEPPSPLCRYLDQVGTAEGYQAFDFCLFISFFSGFFFYISTITFLHGNFI